MMRTVISAALVCMACGAEPGPGPVAADGGGDVAADAAGDRPTGLTPACISTPRLDCDGDGTCETSRDDPGNCGVCGRRCAAPSQCIDGVCL
jgi:hypothetical protein